MIRYLAGLWPADGVDPERIKFNLDLFQYAGIGLALLGATLAVWKARTNGRRIRLSLLVVCIALLMFIAVVRGDPEANPSRTSAQTTKYRF